MDVDRLMALVEKALKTYDAERAAWRYINAVEDEPEDRAEHVRRVAAHAQAMAEIRAAAQALAAPPQGFVLVPVEPTQEMLDHAERENEVPSSHCREVWRAMIAAAPAVPDTKDDAFGLPAVAPQPDESKLPPRPAGYNGPDTDPDSPLKRYGRASKESGLLLEPMDDGYWTPWHIANEMLREAQRNAGVEAGRG